MTIFIGADHRGFELKNKLIEYLQEKNIRVEDLGNYQYEPLDDNPDFAKKVAQAVLQNPHEFLGILICGSGVGVSITANRFKGIRCVLGFNENQVRHARENDHVNTLALPSEYHRRLRLLMDQFAHFAYDVSRQFPKNEIYGLTSQYRRASLSVILNYIEGFARIRINVMKNFFEISYGSLKEAKYLTNFSYKRGYMSYDENKKIIALADEIGAMLWTVISKM